MELRFSGLQIPPPDFSNDVLKCFYVVHVSGTQPQNEVTGSGEPLLTAAEALFSQNARVKGSYLTMLKLRYAV